MNMREQMRRPATRAELTALLIVCFTLAALGLVVSNAQRRASERKFCEVVTTSVRQVERQLAAYEETPPATEAGKAQQEQAQVALGQLSNLSRSLGCM
jgi:ABC-type Na+ efflux pump permease subunit